MNKHFELTDKFITNVFGIKLHQIKATRDSKYVEKGELGGYVESLDNLCDEAWVGDDAQVFGNAKVYGNAWVGDNAQVWGNAKVYGNAQVYDKALVYDSAWVCNYAKVLGNTKISGDAKVYDNAQVWGNAKVFGNAMLSGNAKVYDKAWVYGNAVITDEAQISGVTMIGGVAFVCENAVIKSVDDICTFGYITPINYHIAAFKCEGGFIKVIFNGFKGTLEEFEKEVIKEHGDNKYSKQYLAMIQMIKIKFEI